MENEQAIKELIFNKCTYYKKFPNDKEQEEQILYCDLRPLISQPAETLTLVRELESRIKSHYGNEPFLVCPIPKFGFILGGLMYKSLGQPMYLFRWKDRLSDDKQKKFIGMNENIRTYLSNADFNQSVKVLFLDMTINTGTSYHLAKAMIELRIRELFKNETLKLEPQIGLLVFNDKLPSQFREDIDENEIISIFTTSEIEQVHLG